MSNPPQWQKKSPIYIITRRWEGHGFFFHSFFGAVHDSLFLHPPTYVYLLRPRIRYIPVAAHLVYLPIIRNLDAAVYTRLFFFPSVHHRRLSLSLSHYLSRSPSVCVSLLSTMVIWLKYIVTHRYNTLQLPILHRRSRVSFVRTCIRWIYIRIWHTHTHPHTYLCSPCVRTSTCPVVQTPGPEVRVRFIRPISVGLQLLIVVYTEILIKTTAAVFLSETTVAVVCWASIYNIIIYCIVCLLLWNVFGSRQNINAHRQAV